MSLVIVPAREEHADAVLALVRAMGGHAEISADGFINAYRAVLADPNARGLVAVLAGEVVGYAEVHARHYVIEGRMEGWLAALAVAPRRRGCGIGTALLAETETAARSLGCDAVTVSSSMWRDGAHRFYERAGYDPVGPAQRFVRSLPPPSAEAFLDVARSAAAAVAVALRSPGLARGEQAGPGADGTPTEAADAAADAAALAILRPLGLPVVSEESGISGTVGRRWLALDPLDGTRNFRAGLPPYAIAIGLVEDGRAVAGLVRDLATGTTWCAANGVATRDDRPIRVRTGPVLLAPGPALGAPVRACPPYEAVRVSGATTVDLCRVADGTAAGWSDLHRGVARVVDLAASLAILDAAGGVARLADGAPVELRPDPVTRYRLVAAADEATAQRLLT